MSHARASTGMNRVRLAGVLRFIPHELRTLCVREVLMLAVEVSGASGRGLASHDGVLNVLNVFRR